MRAGKLKLFCLTIQPLFQTLSNAFRMDEHDLRETPLYSTSSLPYLGADKIENHFIDSESKSAWVTSWLQWWIELVKAKSVIKDETQVQGARKLYEQQNKGKMISHLKQ